MSGVVVWMTGLPSSGKSTLATRVRERLLDRGVRALLLDGDEVRAALVPSPGYDEQARDGFYATLARLSALAAKQGFVVIVSATANRRAYRDEARVMAPSFIEVYVATPVDECRARDAKGLYAAAASGSVSAVPGAGAVYEPPIAPDVTASGGDDEQAVRAIVERIEGVSRSAR